MAQGYGSNCLKQLALHIKKINIKNNKAVLPTQITPLSAVSYPMKARQWSQWDGCNMFSLLVEQLNTHFQLLAVEQWHFNLGRYLTKRGS